jgi:hypothetical protein
VRHPQLRECGGDGPPLHIVKRDAAVDNALSLEPPRHPRRQLRVPDASHGTDIEPGYRVGLRVESMSRRVAPRPASDSPAREQRPRRPVHVACSTCEHLAQDRSSCSLVLGPRDTGMSDGTLAAGGATRRRPGRRLLRALTLQPSVADYGNVKDFSRKRDGAVPGLREPSGRKQAANIDQERPITAPS